MAAFGCGVMFGYREPALVVGLSMIVGLFRIGMGYHIEMNAG